MARLTARKCDELLDDLLKVGGAWELERGSDYAYGWSTAKVRRMLHDAGRRAGRKIRTRTTVDGIAFGLKEEDGRKRMEPDVLPFYEDRMVKVQNAISILQDELLYLEDTIAGEYEGIQKEPEVERAIQITIAYLRREQNKSLDYWQDETGATKADRG